MSPETEMLVRETWPRVRARGREASALFYDRLFAIAPESRSLFVHVDMDQQGVKFLSMLDHIVDALDQAPVLVADVAALARRHTAYGAEPSHYASVGAALVWAITEILGEDGSPEVASAWREAYALVAAVMGRAAAKAHAPPLRY